MKEAKVFGNSAHGYSIGLLHSNFSRFKYWQCDDENRWLSRRWSEKWELKSLRQTLNTSFYSNDEILRIVWSFTIFPRWCSRVYHLKLSSKVIRNKRLIVDLEISKERERDDVWLKNYLTFYLPVFIVFPRAQMPMLNLQSKFYCNCAHSATCHTTCEVQASALRDRYQRTVEDQPENWLIAYSL